MRTPAFMASVLLHAAAVVACAFVATGPAVVEREEQPRMVQIRFTCAGDAPGSSPSWRSEEIILPEEEPVQSPPPDVEPVKEPMAQAAAPEVPVAQSPIVAAPSAGSGTGASDEPGAGSGTSGAVGPVASVNPAPAYPRLARKNGWEGRVVVRARVSAEGRPLKVDVVTSSGRTCLDDAAVDAVKRWRFEPARKDGVAIEGDVEIPFRFELASR